MRSIAVTVATILVFTLGPNRLWAAAPDGIFDAVRSADLPALSAMVDRGADINATNSAGQTPLMVAVMQPYDEKLFDLLLNLGADLHARDSAGMTALMHALAKGQVESAGQLLETGLDPDVRDNNGKSALHYAVVGGLNATVGNRPSMVSMLEGKNHKNPELAPYTYYLYYKPGTLSPAEFSKAAVHGLSRKGWGITRVENSGASAFYSRTKQRQLYKVDIKLEPNRIAIRYLPGFGSRDEMNYLDGVRKSLAQELGLY